MGNDKFSERDVLLGCLARGEADLALFDSLDPHSELFDAVTTQPHFMQRDHVVLPIPHPTLVLPESYESFVSS